MIKFYLFDIFRINRQRVDLVCHANGRLDGGNIWIDENGGDALLLQSLKGLRARVIKFTGLTDRKT